MKKRLLLIVIAASLFFVPLKVLAQDSGVPINGSRDERLSKYVTDKQIVLDDSKKQIIETKCQAAQDMLKAVQDNSEALVRRRLTIYGDIQKELQAIKLRMARQGADASETDLITGKLQQAMDDFTMQANRQGLAIDDAINVNCTQKPEQFKASLLILRTQRAKLLDYAIGLKAIMDNSQNSVFNQLKKRLMI